MRGRLGDLQAKRLLVFQSRSFDSGEKRHGAE